jgi:hypothetical protein
MLKSAGLGGRYGAREIDGIDVNPMYAMVMTIGAEGNYPEGKKNHLEKGRCSPFSRSSSCSSCASW